MTNDLSILQRQDFLILGHTVHPTVADALRKAFGEGDVLVKLVGPDADGRYQVWADKDSNLIRSGRWSHAEYINFTKRVEAVEWDAEERSLGGDHSSYRKYEYDINTLLELRR